MKQYAESVVESVHNLWCQHRAEYSAGYAVFYGSVSHRPGLMLIGMNPGGDATCFSGEKERISPPSAPMEYIAYRNDNTYKIAVRTTSLFESIGYLKLLQESVKTNLNFFRSRKWEDLPQQRSEECKRIVVDMIERLEPRVILCESVAVFDTIHTLLSKTNTIPLRHVELNNMGRRIYLSAVNPGNKIRTVIGITHLTGSRPSTKSVTRVAELLKNELREVDT